MFKSKTINAANMLMFNNPLFTCRSIKKEKFNNSERDNEEEEGLFNRLFFSLWISLCPLFGELYPFAYFHTLFSLSWIKQFYF